MAEIELKEKKSPKRVPIGKGRVDLMSSKEFEQNKKYLEEISQRKNQILIELEKQDPTGAHSSRIVAQPKGKLLHA